MSSAAPPDGQLTVPVIDITSFRMPYADTAARARVVRQVDRAARTVGFMHIVGHGIHAAVRDAFTGATDAFFALDPETKRRYRCPAGSNRGYISPPGLFEALNVGPVSAGLPGRGLPDDGYQADGYQADGYQADGYPAREVPGFEAAVTAWFEAAGRVARAMVRIFGVALGGHEDYFASATDHSADVLRINNYRAPEPGAALAPGQLSMGAHTDDGIVTVLWADRAPGLELHGADGRWHPVRPAGGALLVNPGDAIARWTNEEWISPLHRVAAPRVGGVVVPRRSAAYFHDGNMDALIGGQADAQGSRTPARGLVDTV